MSNFKLSIITPRGIFWEGDATIITLKISEGYIGIMKNRLPIMSSVKTSKFSIRESENGSEKFGVLGNGIVQANGDEVTVIVKDIVWLKETEVNEVSKHLTEANYKLEKADTDTKKEKAKTSVEFWTLVSEGQ